MKTMAWAGLVLGSVLLSACETQPELGCMTARGGFAAKYTLKPGQQVEGACTELKGEVIGVQTYHPAKETSEGVKPDTRITTLAIRTETLGMLEGQDPDHAVTSLGGLSSEPDADSTCHATDLSTAEQHIAASEEQPQLDLAYSWKHVGIVSKPEIPGTQLWADLSYTAGGCTAEYSVRAVWPVLWCFQTDEEGNPVLGDDGAPVADDSLCGPGSGMNPDFPVHCDPDVGLCVLDSDPPTLR
ncbi:MAG: hypothetical protein HY901_03330 [Deltaproteobacteria bacterium]|nr:hypothetical protein [Deltaproteobacteria bacterium]